MPRMESPRVDEGNRTGNDEGTVDYGYINIDGEMCVWGGGLVLRCGSVCGCKGTSVRIVD